MAALSLLAKAVLSLNTFCSGPLPIRFEVRALVKAMFLTLSTIWPSCRGTLDFSFLSSSPNLPSSPPAFLPTSSCFSSFLFLGLFGRLLEDVTDDAIALLEVLEIGLVVPQPGRRRPAGVRPGGCRRRAGPTGCPSRCAAEKGGAGISSASLTIPKKISQVPEFDEAPVVVVDPDLVALGLAHVFDGLLVRVVTHAALHLGREIEDVARRRRGEELVLVPMPAMSGSTSVLPRSSPIVAISPFFRTSATTVSCQSRAKHPSSSGAWCSNVHPPGPRDRFLGRFKPGKKFTAK